MPSRKPSTFHSNHHNPKRPRLHPSKHPAQSSRLPPQTSSAAPPPSHHQKPTIPFLPTDHILLVGEGDFSFAYSLFQHHAFTSLVASSLDSRDVVLEKYPHAVKNLRGLENWGLGGRDGGGGGEGCNRKYGGEEHEEEEEEEENGNGNELGEARQNGEIEKDGEENDDTDQDEEAEDQHEEKCKEIRKEVRVKFGVDATKLTRAKVLGRTKIKKKNKGGPAERGFDKIVFNFPHVGGKTKDVNRQVRYNQDLLVSFLTTSLPLLSPGGVILITLFEGLPYSLWNIRDLARHVGLRVGRSFKFDAGAYPGYRHARTGGVVKAREGGGGGNGRTGLQREEGGEGSSEDQGSGESGEGLEEREAAEDDNDEKEEAEREREEETENEKEKEKEERRGWKGETRPSRTYLFELVEKNPTSTSPTNRKQNQNPTKKKKKREKGKGGGSEDGDDDDDDDEDD